MFLFPKSDSSTGDVPYLSQDRREVRRRELRREKKMIKEFINKLKLTEYDSIDPSMDKLLFDILKTKYAETLFPTVYKQFHRNVEYTYVNRSLKRSFACLGNDGNSAFKMPLLGMIIANADS